MPTPGMTPLPCLPPAIPPIPPLLAADPALPPVVCGEKPAGGGAGLGPGRQAPVMSGGARAGPMPARVTLALGRSSVPPMLCV
eukprot:1157869-Pelagomonas_calceolata.AAC.9